MIRSVPMCPINILFFLLIKTPPCHSKHPIIPIHFSMHHQLKLNMRRQTPIHLLLVWLLLAASQYHYTINVQAIETGKSATIYLLFLLMMSENNVANILTKFISLKRKRKKNAAEQVPCFLQYLINVSFLCSWPQFSSSTILHSLAQGRGPEPDMFYLLGCV